MRKVVTQKTEYDTAEEIERAESAPPCDEEPMEQENEDTEVLNKITDLVRGRPVENYAIELYRYDPDINEPDKFAYICSLDIGDFTLNAIKNAYGGGKYKVHVRDVTTKRKLRNSSHVFTIHGAEKDNGKRGGLQDEERFSRRELLTRERDEKTSALELVKEMKTTMREGVELGKGTSAPSSAGNPIELAKEIHTAMMDGIALAKGNTPEQSFTSFNEVFKAMSGSFAIVMDNLSKNLAVINQQQQQLAQRDIEINNKFMTLMQQTMMSQMDMNAKSLEVQRSNLDSYKELLELRASITNPSDSKSSWMEIAGKALDLIRERGPELLHAVAASQFPPSPITLAPQPTVAQAIRNDLKDIAEEGVQGQAVEGGSVELGEEMRTDNEMDLIEDFTGLVLTALERNYPAEDVIKSVTLVYTPEELAFLLEAWQGGRFSEEVRNDNRFVGCINWMIKAALSVAGNMGLSTEKPGPPPGGGLSEEPRARA